MIDAGQTAQALLTSPAFAATLRRLTRAADAGDETQMLAWACYVTALHDIGKCHGDFQGKGPAELVAPLEASGLRCQIQQVGFRHDAFASDWLATYLRSEQGWHREASRTAADAIAAHHGTFVHEQPMGEPPSQMAGWEPVRVELAGLVHGIFRPPVWEARFVDHSVAGLLLSGLVVLSDWMASNPDLFPSQWAGQSIGDYALASAKQAAIAVERLGFMVDWPFRSGMRFDEVWPQYSPPLYSPREVQMSCAQIGRDEAPPGLVILEAPMGEGKTEAALHLAAQWGSVGGLGGIYMALPTAATSNQMHARLQEFLGIHDSDLAGTVRLVHGMAWLVDDQTPVSPSQVSSESSSSLDWFRPKKRALLAAFGVGTVDQALMSVLAVKHGFLRLFGLAGKTLVIDEVHAYDAYMTEILTRLLRWCSALGVPVLLLSATLPASRRRALVEAYRKGAGETLASADQEAPYPLLTVVAGGSKAREVEVPPSGRATDIRVIRHDGLLCDIEGTIEVVAETVLAGPGCRVVVANTVREAQEIFQGVGRSLEAEGRGDVRRLLFHSRFRARRRAEVERQTLDLFDRRSLLSQDHADRTERPRSSLLVATQVVEQSLDLDFDEMFSHFAPTDLLLQRVGRLHRHPRPERPTGPEARLHLLTPDDGLEFGGTGYVYDHYVLLRALLALEGREWLRLPSDIRYLVEATYGPEDPPATALPAGWAVRLSAARQEHERRLGDEAKKAKVYLIPDPDPRRFRLADPQLYGPFDEAEGDAASFFAARTRLGDDSMAVILLEGEVFQKELAEPRSPSRETIKRLLLESVNLPRFWFHGCQPLEGFPGLTEAPSWLPGYHVLRLRDSLWQGVDHKGRPVSVRDDVDLGVVRERGDDA